MMYRLFLLVIFLCSNVSCKNAPKVDAMTTEVMAWTNKKIRFPSIDVTGVLDTLLKSKYKIVAYFDSVGCMECKLALDEWDIKMKSLRKKTKEVNLIMIIHSSHKDAIDALCSKHRFLYPVFVDEYNLFYKENELNDLHDFQVFLLDENNKVKAVGDPILNENLWGLYKKRMNVY